MSDDGVAEIAAAVSRGRRGATDVVAEHVDRCRAAHARLNALVQPRFAEAIAEARRESPCGPLAGTPVSVKECFAVRGLETTLGVRGRRGRRDTEDADVVARLRAAGAVVLGKANVPQVLYFHETDNPVWGRTLHPTHPDRGPGGSSGGDAALVAAGCVPLAIGNDLAGSVRQPAHACGIVGLLPRRATLGGGGAYETMPGFPGERSRAGILSRSVDDAALALRALVPEVAEAAEAIPVGRRLRVGWWDDAGPLSPSPAVRRAVALAVERAAAVGMETEPLDHGIAAEAAWAHFALLSADGGDDIRRLFHGARPIAQVRRLLAMNRLSGVSRRLVIGACAWTGRRIEAEALSRTGRRTSVGSLLARRDEIGAMVDRWSRQIDAILCPVSALPALRHGTAARLVLAAAPCTLANLLDLAAGTVPVTRVAAGEEAGRERSRDPLERLAAAADRGSAGLPVGVQVISLHRDAGAAEEVVIRVLRAIAGEGVSRSVSH